MPSGVYPAIQLKPLPRISPSRYHSLQLCALKELFSSNKYPALMPTSPSARLGSAAHRIFELANRGQIGNQEKLEAKWEEVIREIETEMLNSELESHLVPLHKHAYNYQVKKNMTSALARAVMQKKDKGIKPQEDCRAESEVWLETEDSKIGGKIDLLLHHASGVEISDFKTGSIVEKDSGSTAIKEEYRIQLHLYAGLYHEVRKDWPEKLTLIGLDGTAHHIAFNANACHKLISEARARLEELNRKIGDGAEPEQFASPSPNACFFCSFRPACKKYQTTVRENGDWPSDVSGRIIQKRTLGNGSVRIVVDTGNKKIAIRGLSPQRHKVLNQETNDLFIYNVGKDSSEDFYIQTPLTVVYRTES